MKTETSHQLIIFKVAARTTDAQCLLSIDLDHLILVAVHKFLKMRRIFMTSKITRGDFIYLF